VSYVDTRQSVDTNSIKYAVVIKEVVVLAGKLQYVDRIPQSHMHLNSIICPFQSPQIIHLHSPCLTIVHQITLNADHVYLSLSPSS